MLGKRTLNCLLLFTCNYVVSVWRGFLFLWVLGMGYVILFWQSLSLPYNYFATNISYTVNGWLQTINLLWLSCSNLELCYLFLWTRNVLKLFIQYLDIWITFQTFLTFQKVFIFYSWRCAVWRP